MTTINVLREVLVKQLTNVKEDNIGIAGVTIDRKKLLTALKIQTADIVNINYGQVSWNGEHKSGGTVDQALCIQFQCNHQTFRFLDRPNYRHGVAEPKHLNFIEQVMNAEPKLLTGTPIDTVDLLDALTFIIHGLAKEDTRPVLQCVLFDSTEDGILKLVAADGFRLPLAKIQVEGLAADKVMIHSSDIKTLITYLKGQTSGKGRHKFWIPVYLEYEAEIVRFSSDLGQVEFTKQPGNFPNYEQLIPKHGTHIELTADDMLKAVKAVTPMAKDGSGIVRLKFQVGYPVGKVIISSRSEELGDSSVECQAKVESDCQIAFNSSYLKDFLSTCKDSIIDLFVTQSSSPMVAHNGLEQSEVIMPMFVQWGD